MPFSCKFNPATQASEQALWFLFSEQRLLVYREASEIRIPGAGDVQGLGLKPVGSQYIGSLDEQPCYAGELDPAARVSGGYAFIGLRQLFMQAGEQVIRASGTANQLVEWSRKHRYCGRCGHAMEDKVDERAKICPRCEAVYYPRLSPAVIVAVVRGDRILLAHSHRFPAKFYSVLAGFVEPGETLEECVQREVFEEVGVRVDGVRYFDSQPWPFPDSLMIGFTAEYAGGDIRIDDSEIADAGWFSADNLPAVPPRISIARRLIDWFIAERRT
jgi:NAD+ diphosphatase